MACWPKPSATSRRDFAWCPSPATGCFRLRNRARWCTRSMPRAHVCRSRRSRPTRDMTPSCSTCRSSSTLHARSCNRVARRAGSEARMATADQTLPLPGLAPSAIEQFRADHLLVAGMVTPGSRVLDVGCGDGDLLQLLESRGIDGRGIELSREGVNRCVAKGLAVVQGDADTDLVNYPDDAFDYVILSQTLQATRQPKAVLENLLRIGRRAIVSFPNFGFWKMRLQLLI